MQKKIKYLFSFFAAALIIVYLFHIIVKANKLSLINNLSINQTFVLTLISLGIFIVNGSSIYLSVKNQFHIKIDKKDILFLPATMHLWSYIIPVRGGILYFIYALKNKYQLNLISGISFGIYTILINIFLCGIIGIFIYFAAPNSHEILFILSLSIMAIPIIFFSISALKIDHIKFKNSLLNKAINIYTSTASITANKTIFIIHLASYIAGLFVSISFYYSAALFLNIQTTILQVVLISLSQRISLIFKFTPGNMGIQEWFTSTAYTLSGGNFTDGLILSLMLRCFEMIIAFTIGTAGHILNHTGANLKKTL